MITIISGTNRIDSFTFTISKLAEKYLNSIDAQTQLIDLQKLPSQLFSPKNYGNPNKSFLKYQNMILNCNGILVLTPEYNGSFPGVLKYFIDLLKFPDSLQNIPSGFIGIAAGVFGGLRAVEQLEMIFQYRKAHIYGERTFFMDVNKKINPDKNKITDKYTKDHFEAMLAGFKKFVYKIQPVID